MFLISVGPILKMCQIKHTYKSRFYYYDGGKQRL